MTNAGESPITMAEVFQKAWQREPQITLCDIQAQEGMAVASVGGACPIHGGDACLYVYGQVAAIRHRLGEIERALGDRP